MRLESSLDGCAVVHHYSESSLVVEVKSKQHLDLALMELKESILTKLNEYFYLWGMVCLDMKGDYVFPLLMVEGSDL